MIKFRWALLSLCILCTVGAAGIFAYQITKQKNTPVLQREILTDSDIKENNEAQAIKGETLEANPKKTTFLFAGDMMFDRFVNHSFKDKGFDTIFGDLDKSLFQNKDIVFANLEGPVSDKPTPDDYPDRSLVFNMPPETISTIKNLGLNGVSLANNHTLNAGERGFISTQTLLANAGLKYGGSQNGFDEGSVIRYETSIPVSVIAVDLLSYKNYSVIEETIKKEKEAGNFTVFFPHWGEEYSLEHSSNQEQIAHRLIDAGADLIVGNHPHVVQDIEIYKDKPIFYALGNFVFDQLFSKETQEGLIVAGEITEDSLSIKLWPFKSENMKPRLMNETEKEEILKRISEGKEKIDLIPEP